MRLETLYNPGDKVYLKGNVIKEVMYKEPLEENTVEAIHFDREEGLEYILNNEYPNPKENQIILTTYLKEFRKELSEKLLAANLEES